MMLEKLTNALIELLKIKSLITISVIFTACYLALDGRLDVAIFVGMATAIITYYFNKKDSGK